MPQPTSRTDLMSDGAPDHLSCSSMKSYFAWMKSFFLYPAASSASV